MVSAFTLCSTELETEKIEILNTILKSENYIPVYEFPFFYGMKKNSKYIFHNLTLQQIHYLQKHKNEIIVFTSSKNKNEAFFEKLLSFQITNVVFLGKPVEWILPGLYYTKKNSIFLLFVSASFGETLKSIIHFSGNLAFSFHNEEEFLYFLRNSELSFDHVFCVVDIDIIENIVSFLAELQKRIQAFPFEEKIHFLWIKDLEKGFFDSVFDFFSAKETYRTLFKTKKIFSMHSFLLFLIDNLILAVALSSLKKPSEDENSFFLKALYSKDLSFANSKAIEYNNGKEEFLFFYRKVLPVLWLHGYLRNTARSGDIIYLA